MAAPRPLNGKALDGRKATLSKKSSGPLGRGVEVLATGLGLLALGDVGIHTLTGQPVGQILSVALAPGTLLVPTGIIVVLGEIFLWRRWIHWRTFAGVCLILVAVAYIPGFFRRAIDDELRPRTHGQEAPSRSPSNTPMKRTMSPQGLQE